MQTLRWGCAEAMLRATEQAARRCGLPRPVEADALAAVQPVAGRVRDGSLGLGAGLAFQRGLASREILAPWTAAGLVELLGEGMLPDRSEPSPAALAINFCDMYKTGRIGPVSWSALEDLVTEEREVSDHRPSGLVITDRVRRMKPTLSDEELARLTALLSAAGEPTPPEGFPPPAVDPLGALKALLARIDGEAAR